MRVLIIGSTTWTDTAAIRHELLRLPAPATIVTGDTPGVDGIAIQIAAEFGFAVEAMKKSNADKRSHPGESWKGLNERMLGTGIDLVLAFHADYGKPGHARGTHHAVDLAKAAGVETRVIDDHRLS